MSSVLPALSACGSDTATRLGEGTLAPSATVAKATAAPPDTKEDGLKDFNNFARQLQAALTSGDASSFSSRIEETSVTCSGSAEPRGACANQAPGTVLRGLPSDMSEGAALQIIPPADYVSTTQTWLASARPDLSNQFGSGVPTLCAVGRFDASDNTGSYLAVLGEIYAARGSVERQALVLSFPFKDDARRLVVEERAVNPGTPERWLFGNCTARCDEWEQWSEEAG